MLISIIAPVYNVAPYFTEFVNSVRHQTIPDFELILIDDGSNDGSSEMCDQFAQEDDRIKVVHQANRGASAARNHGLKLMTGDYVTFVDSDDVLDEDYLQILYDHLISHHADIAVTNYKVFHQANDCFYYYLTDGDLYTRDLTPKEACEYQSNWDFNSSIFIVPFCKLFKAELLEYFQFPEGMIFEDEASIHRLFMKAHKIVLINENHYIYRQGIPSVMTSQMDDKRVEDLIKCFQIKLTDFVMAGYDYIPTRNRFERILLDYQRIFEANQLTDSHGYHLIQEMLLFGSQYHGAR